MATQLAHPTTTSRMAQACSDFLESLDSAQRARTTYAYEDGERVFWYYAPLNRHGLPLRDMNAEQRRLAYRVLASGLTDKSYGQATKIIDHESILGPLEVEEDRITFVRDPDLYYFTVFGEPGSDRPWGWRAEGHHLSLNYSIWGDRVISGTPFFFGANPAEVPAGRSQAGMRILADCEDIALELADSLDAGQRAKALLYDEAPNDILTFSAVRASMPEEQGLAASQMSATQREILTALITEYVTRAPEDFSGERLSAIRENGIDGIHLAWGGALDRSAPHYYRLHGGNFVVEFDNQQNGANHIHSVWRDVVNDFANDVLREHLILYHVL